MLASTLPLPPNATYGTVTPATFPSPGTVVCSRLVATDNAGNVATAVSNGAVLDNAIPVGGTIAFGLPGVRASQRRYWNTTAGVSASYSDVYVGLLTNIATLEWAVYQCPVGELPAHHAGIRLRVGRVL